MTLLAVCTCGANVPAESLVAGRCLECRADELCAPERAELVRLAQKRARLTRVGASTRSCDEQAQRTRMRIIRRCQTLTATPASLIDRQGRLAREASQGPIALA